MKVESKAVKAKIKDLEAMKKDFLQSVKKYNNMRQNTSLAIQTENPTSVELGRIAITMTEEYLFVCSMVEYLVSNYGYQLNFDCSLIEFLEKEGLAKKAEKFIK